MSDVIYRLNCEMLMTPYRQVAEAIKRARDESQHTNSVQIEMMFDCRAYETSRMMMWLPRLAIYDFDDPCHVPDLRAVYTRLFEEYVSHMVKIDATVTDRSGNDRTSPVTGAPLNSVYFWGAEFPDYNQLLAAQYIEEEAMTAVNRAQWAMGLTRGLAKWANGSAGPAPSTKSLPSPALPVPEPAPAELVAPAPDANLAAAAANTDASSATA